MLTLLTDLLRRDRHGYHSATIIHKVFILLLGGQVMDWRVLIVLLPVLLAGAWAVRNILPFAIKQFQKFFPSLGQR